MLYAKACIKAQDNMQDKCFGPGVDQGKGVLRDPVPYLIRTQTQNRDDPPPVSFS